MSLSPDITELLVDPELGAQPFTITRRKGKWVEGSNTVDSTETIKAIGIIQPPSSEEMQYFPEGERRENCIAIYSQTIMHLSSGKDFADSVTWRGEEYKIIRVDRWDDYGYCVAYAQKR